MSNPFNLADEQIAWFVRTFDKTNSFVTVILEEAERMAKENAEAAFTVDWDNVPPEYRFAAADGSGRIYFYTKSVVPLLASPVWYIPEPGEIWIKRGFSQAVADGKIDWRTTLRERPKEECPVSNDLFPDLEPSMSPKLRWLQRHNVTVERNPRIADDEEPWEAWVGDSEAAAGKQIDHNGDTTGPYFAAANTEEEALYKLAVANEWKLWNEEG